MERAHAYLEKLSKKGWVCKTWEDELLLVAMPCVTPEKFLFTVRDEAVATRINQLMGKRVALNYAQDKGLPSSRFGEAEYFVADLKETL